MDTDEQVTPHDAEWPSDRDRCKTTIVIRAALTGGTMHNTRILAGIALATALAGCVIRPGTPDSSLAPGAEWTATLVPTTASAIRGTVTFVRTDPPNQTRVIFSLTDGTANAVRPWHVHFGVCGNDKMIVGMPANYPPLVMSSQGNVSAIAQLPVELVKGTNYVIHLHASPSDMKTVIACAPLMPGGSAAIAVTTR